MTTLLPIRAIFQTAQTLYAIRHGLVAGVEKVFNFNDAAWEVYNSAHWADYAIPLTEQAGSGYYTAAAPAGTTLAIVWDAIYQQAGGGPTLGDTPAMALQNSQGENVAGVSGDADVPSTLQEALLSEQRGACTGVPTTSIIPTDLDNVQANAYQGRSILFTSGPAFQCAGRIIGYTALGVITLAAPLPVAPEAADTFVIA